MPRPTQRKRRIRELLDVLADENQRWRPIHTHMLVDLAVADDAIKESWSIEMANRRKEELAAQRADLEAKFKEQYERKIERYLDRAGEIQMVAAEFAVKEISDPKTGEIDVTRLADLNRDDLKVGLQAVQHMLDRVIPKASQQIQVEHKQSVFEAYDELEDEQPAAIETSTTPAEDQE